LLRRREVSSEELVSLYCERIARIDGGLGAFVSTFTGSAMRAARRHDARRGAGGAPFAGVPIGIKDVNQVRGSFTRFGSRAFRWFFSPLDDATVRAIRAGGF